MTRDSTLTLAERIDRLLPRITYAVVRDDATMILVGALRYRACLAEGAVLPMASGQVRDRFDDAPNGLIVAIWLDQQLVASVRLHVVSFLHGTQSPAIDAFPDALSDEIGQGRLILDLNRLVIDREASRLNPELIYATFRVPFMAAKHFAVDIVTATVRAEHQAFYRRVLRYRTLTDTRPYPGLLKPLYLMVANLPQQSTAVLRSYPFLAARPGEAASLFDA